MNYPISYIFPTQLKDGSLVQLRPIHPTDGASAQAFRKKVSDESVRDRFLGYIPSISQKLINRLTKIDYDREMAIVAECVHQEKKEAIAVARIVGEDTDLTKAEFAVIIADKWQGKGLGSTMTDYMISIAKDMGFQTLFALLYSHNVQMEAMLLKRGFAFKKEGYDTNLATLDLKENKSKIQVNVFHELR